MKVGPLLDGKVVVISGVGPGMGQQLAKLCAEQGAKLVLGARSTEFLNKVLGEVQALGAEAIAVPTDVADPAACKALIQAAVDRFGGVDGLVNSAYRHEVGLFAESDLQAWRKAFDVTFWGALELIQAAIPHLEKAKGAVVNVSTLSTRIPTVGLGGYGIPKAALDMATRQLATELGGRGIRVNGTLMGWMDGEPMRHGFDDRAKARGKTPEQWNAELNAMIPIGRMPTDEECARSVVFFLSEWAAPVTGALLMVNGGQYTNP